MIRTLRKPKSPTPLRPAGLVHDPAALASMLRDVSASAHRALKLGADASTISRLTARIDGIERGFRDLGLHELARYAGNLKRKLEDQS
jgi:hypothetical protein